MNEYGEIMDPEGIQSITEMIGVEGIKMDYDTWALEQFCPCKGCVGAIIGDGYCAEGPVWILRCAKNVYVPVSQWAVKIIPQSDYFNKVENNVLLGKDPDGSRCREAQMKAAMSSFSSFINGLELGT